jgi:N-acyl-D-amino-acid deacylase
MAAVGRLLPGSPARQPRWGGLPGSPARQPRWGGFTGSPLAGLKPRHSTLVFGLLCATACGGGGGCGFSIGAGSEQPAADLLIKGATIIDGSGTTGRSGDVAVKDGKIVAVDAALSMPATRTIDAKGRVLAPGFIDMHSHSDVPLVTDGNAQSKIRQGVTTEVIGESGSVAPRKTAGEGSPWTDFNGYFATLEKNGVSVNVLSYVGLGTVREVVVGEEDRPATTTELQAMQGVVRTALDQGVFGVSTGLIYPPNAYASLDELVALSEPAGAAGGLHASHLRYDGLKLREGLEEIIAIGERAVVPVHVFHLKVTGARNFGRMKEVIEIIEGARARSIRVTADQYPYVASSTSLTATIPQWAEDGGTDKLVERLKDPKLRARIRKEMEDPNPTWENRYQSAGTWDNIQLAAIGRTRGRDTMTESPNRKYEGMRIGEAARLAGKDPFDFVFDLLIEERGSVGCVYFIMSEDDLKLALRQPWVGIGSDGSALATEGPLKSGVPHPRSFGTFPRVLGRYVREQQVISLQEAIRKMTSLPASILGLHDRGTIAEGKQADLVLLDPATVADRATFEDPFQYPVGIDTVIVNGQVVLDEGRHTNARPGQALRRQSSSSTDSPD